MCAASAASSRLAGWMVSPRCAQHGRHRLLGEPLDLEARHLASQLVGDRNVAPGVTEADRRRDEQRSLGAVEHARPRAPGGRPAADAVEQVAQHQVDLHRIAGLGRVARALQPDQPAPCQLRHAHAALELDDVVVGAVDDHHRAAQAPQERLDLFCARDARRRTACRDQGLGIRVEAPGDAVLDLLGRVRLGEHLAEEELEEPAIVPQPEVPVELRPALVGLELGVERERVAPETGRDEERDRGREDGRPERALRVPPREERRVETAERESDDARLLDACGIEHRGRVLDVLDGSVRAGLGRAVREPVATAVERDDARVSGEVGDLALPHARVHDRPGGQEQDRGRSRPVALPVDPDAVSRDDALLVRRSRRAPGVAPPHLVDRSRHGRASNTRLKGVSAARRKRLKPPAATTSPIRASPAWAPRASPTSCDSDAGVQRNVEKP